MREPAGEPRVSRVRTGGSRGGASQIDIPEFIPRR
jgi:hypothetical protein